MRHFVLLFIGALVTSIGTGMTIFALSVVAYQTLGTASSVALIQLAGFAPLVLLAPVAGVLADRIDRRLMMLIGDIGSMGGLVLVYWASTQPTFSLPLVLIGLSASAVFAACTEPALRATVNDLVSEADYQRASGMLQLAASSKFLISPVLASFVLAKLGLSSVLLIDMATCVVTVACTVVVRHALNETADRQAEEADGPITLADGIQDFLTGLKVLTQASQAWTAVLMMSAFALFLGFLQTLLKPILLPLADVTTVSLAETVSACGLIVGSLVLTFLGKRHPFMLIASGSGVVGLAMILLCARPHVWWVAAMGFAVFAALALVNAGAEVTVRTGIPNEYQGRVWGAIHMISQFGFLAAFGLAGPLTDWVFEPLLAPGGLFAPTLGELIGTGHGRGAAFLIALIGVGTLGVAVKALREANTPALVEVSS